MSTKYILHPDGTIKKIDDNLTDPPPVVEASAEINKERFVDNDNFYSYSIKNKDDLEGINGGFGYNSVSGNYDGPVKETSQNNSFGFLGGQDKPKEYISFNSFLDKDGDEIIPYASEFEIVTGIRPATEYTGGVELVELQEFTFVFEYLATVIVKVVAVEIIMAISQNSLSRDGFGVEQRRIYSFGEYDFTDYDVFTRYITEVLNYPKHKSEFKDRLLAYFVGLIEYLSTDNFFDLESFLENNVGFFNTDSYFAVILNYTTKLALSSLLTEQGKKKLLLLTKKFNTQQYWLENNLYPHKKKYTWDDIINPFNYYHFKFIIERINVGLKIINRKITRRIDISNKHYSDNRVSGYRTSTDWTLKITPDDQANQQAELTEAVLAQANKLSNSTEREISKFSYEDSIEAIDGILSNYGNEKVEYTWDNSSVRESTGLNLSKIPQAFLYNKNLRFILDTEKDPVYFESSPVISKNFAKTESKRIPISLINKIEESLELEYVPFYFHDIRTNELVSLHAFVESVSDSYSPEYSSSGGFGRIDDVKTYVKTTRNISLSFFIAALSPEDHDLMWYQINKLVSMVYPQWSKGFEISKGTEENFTYPFSQVITSSPLIRIRLGDVITSNYSKTNLTRIFGVNENVDTGVSKGKFARYYLMSGKYEIYEYDYSKKYFHNTGKIFSLDKEIKLVDMEEHNNDVFVKPKDYASWPTRFYLKTSKDFIIKKDETFPAYRAKPSLRKFKKDMMDSVKSGAVNNPFTASYESGMSKGLAGHITNLDLNYQDMTWETSRIGSKAPMLAKINITFAPIHDIPPGLDHMGMMRAPHYNVGTLNNSMFGDPLDKENTNDFREKVMNKYQKSIKLG